MIKIALINIIKDLECPPLTLAYLGTYLKKHNKAEVKIIDINFDDVMPEIKSYNPDIVGMSAHTVRFNFAKELAKKIRKISKAKIVIGGVHISTFPESFSQDFNLAIIGEGEETFSKVVRLVEKGTLNNKELEKIKGMMFWDSGKVKKTETNQLMKDIDKIPIPDRSLFNKEYFKPKVSYNKLRGKKVIEAGILTSRGCPYHCTFCSASAFWNRIRFHSSEYVAKEVKYLIDNFNVNYLVVYDDFFAISVDRLTNIIKSMRKSKTLGKVKFSCSARANVITDELCKAMKELGIITVNFGFESGSDKILKKLKGENVTVQQNIDAVKICRKYGLDVTGSFILGSPGEKIEDMKKTLEVIKKMKELGASELWCGVAVPYPGTELWRYAIKNNLLKNFNWNYADPSYIHNPIFLDKSVSKKQFLDIFKEIKEISLDIAPGGKEDFANKVKERIYYNKTLYTLSAYCLRIFPKSIREKVLTLFNIKGTLSTK